MSKDTTLIDVENAFIAAVAFKTVAMVEAKGSHYLNASLVNKAFAVEVYLKCLHAIENPAHATDEHFKELKPTSEDLEKVGYTVRGHTLKSLFEHLSEDSRSVIASSVNAAIKARPSKGGFITCAEGDYPKFSSIDDVLSTISDVFTRMRYTFEITNEKPRSVVYVDELLGAVEDRILSLRPVFRMWCNADQAG